MMKKIFYCFAIIFMISCEKTVFTKSEFILVNDSDYTIDVYSTAIVVSQINGNQSKTIHDIVKSKQKISLRIIEVSDTFEIKSVFTKLEIYNGQIKSSYDVMSKVNWSKVVVSDSKNEYTLTVNNSFFK